MASDGRLATEILRLRTFCRAARGCHAWRGTTHFCVRSTMMTAKAGRRGARLWKRLPEPMNRWRQARCASRFRGLNRESNRCRMDLASTCPPPYEIVAHDHSHFFPRRRLTCGAPFAFRGPSCRFKPQPRHTQQRIRDVRATASHRIDPGVAVVLSASGRVRTSTTAGLPENNGKRRQAGSQHVCGSQLHRRGNGRPRQEFHPGVGQRLINQGTDPASAVASDLRRTRSDR